MDIRVLRYFLAVAREENITRAAESLHIAQPSLSKQIMELEKELGKKLIIRGKRKIILTEEGILLRKRAEEIVNLLEKTEREIGNDSEEVVGDVYIGGNSPNTILKAASSLQEKYHDICFHFYSSDATDVTELLDQGSLDFAILLEPVETTKYEFISLPDDSMWGVLMKKDSFLSKKSKINKDDLVSIPLIIHRRIGLQQQIAHWAQVELEQLNIVATYNVMYGSPVSFVKNNLGYFLITRDLLAPKLDDSVCFKPLSPTLKVKYALVWKRHNIFSKAARVFLDKVKEEI